MPLQTNQPTVLKDTSTSACFRRARELGGRLQQSHENGGTFGRHPVREYRVLRLLDTPFGPFVYILATTPSRDYRAARLSEPAIVM